MWAIWSYFGQAGDGFDITHSGRRNPKALVYEFMEPLRPVVDRQILQFALAHSFTPGDFMITKQGGCRLNPQMAKAAVKAVSGEAAQPHAIKWLRAATSFLLRPLICVGGNSVGAIQ